MFQGKTSKIGPFNFVSPFTCNSSSSVPTVQGNFYRVLAFPVSHPMFLPLLVGVMGLKAGVMSRWHRAVVQEQHVMLGICSGTGSFPSSPVNLHCGVLRDELGGNNRFPSLGCAADEAGAAALALVCLMNDWCQEQHLLWGYKADD